LLGEQGEQPLLLSAVSYLFTICQLRSTLSEKASARAAASRIKELIVLVGYKVTVVSDANRFLIAFHQNYKDF
jgi:hypothetical protein